MKGEDPYFTRDGKAKLHLSLCLWMDVLGLKDKTKDASREQKEELLDSFVRAMDLATDFIQHDLRDGWLGHIPHAQYQTFSDSTLVVEPVQGEVPTAEELISLLSQGAGYQALFASRGYFVRGAVTLGEAHVGPKTMFGLPLIEAYETESSKAVYPRVVLSDEVRSCTGQVLETSRGRNTTLSEWLLMDSDGMWFVDYLDILSGVNTNPNWCALDIHRRAIVTEMSNAQNRPSVLAKYLWVANYHNYACNRLSDRPGYSRTHLIDINEAIENPRVIGHSL